MITSRGVGDAKLVVPATAGTYNFEADGIHRLIINVLTTYSLCYVNISKGLPDGKDALAKRVGTYLEVVASSITSDAIQK